jgi:hypothetical protein
VPTEYAEHLAAADPQLKRFCQFIIILGLLLDGEISYRERQRISLLHTKGILEPSVSDLVAFKNDFLEGRGLMTLAKMYFD